ncbi:MAG TPA: hypothetical protein VLZ82_02460, partial [Microbacterium sp.]|nr:hypothetical protein [Microbacterium sp.]
MEEDLLEGPALEQVRGVRPVRGAQGMLERFDEVALSVMPSSGPGLDALLDDGPLSAEEVAQYLPEERMASEPHPIV